MNKRIFLEAFTEMVHGKRLHEETIKLIMSNAIKVAKVGHAFIRKVALTLKFNPDDKNIYSLFYAGVTGDCEERLDQHNTENTAKRCWDCQHYLAALVVEKYFHKLGCEGGEPRATRKSTKFYLYYITDETDEDA
ncbi:MAG TPA: hypothetical protein PKH33_17675 [bacterium]|nr:hypothetical protein [bacterium]HPN95307.1 hypothetical protein [bacterium]